MNIIYSCGAKTSYIRNFLNIKILSEKYNVLNCGTNFSKYFIRLPVALIKTIFSIKKADIIFVGYLGHLFIPIIRFFTKKPIIFDAFVSLYEMICVDRKIFKENSLISKIIFYIEKKSYDLSNFIIIDTKSHLNLLVDKFNIKLDKIDYIFVGTNEEIFKPKQKNINDNIFRIHFHGTYIPLHGIKYILKAAKELENHKDIQFTIYGNGQTFKNDYKIYKELNLKNVILKNNTSLENLSDNIANCDLGLGIFGDGQKAKLVIPNKAYNIIAMKKPLLTGETIGINELLKNNYSCYTCKMSDYKDIANKIIKIKNDSNINEIANNGYNQFKNFASYNKISEKIINIIKKYEQPK